MDTIEDPLLAMTAETLLDFERVRIAAENRLRQLTRSEADVDGRERGFGLTAEHPTVMATQKLVEGMVAVEHQAELHLAKLMREHPLGPWMRAQPGIGMKQGARLLASIGDPYIRPDRRRDGVIVPARPRTVSELWAYCGMGVIDLPVDQGAGDAQPPPVGGEAGGGDPSHRAGDTHPRTAGVAPSRRRGQRSNWNADARMRVYLVAAQTVQMLRKPCFVPDGASWATHVDGCRCGRWRVLYDAAKQKYSTAVHRLPCPRCGPAGRPAPIGSPLSDGHKHARSVRIVAKTILKELWREAGRLHGANTDPPAAAMSTPTPRAATPLSGPTITPTAVAVPTTIRAALSGSHTPTITQETATEPATPMVDPSSPGPHLSSLAASSSTPPKPCSPPGTAPKITREVARSPSTPKSVTPSPGPHTSSPTARRSTTPKDGSLSGTAPINTREVARLRTTPIEESLPPGAASP